MNNSITGSPYAALNIPQPCSADPVPVPSLDKGGGQLQEPMMQ